MMQKSHTPLERAAARPSRAALVFAVLLGTLVAGIASTALAQQPDRIRTGGQFPPIYEYVYRSYAIDGGFMQQQNIDAEFVGFTAGLTGMQALLSGSVDFACEGMTGTLGGIAQGGDIRIILIINSDNTYVIVFRDAIDSPEDIRGRTWAVSQVGAISQTYAQLWLSHYGLEEGAVDWIPVGGTAARARALLAGQVDATMLTLGEWLRVQDQPGIKLVSYLADVVPPLPLSACSTSTTLIEENPELVQRYVNAVLDAVRYARTPEGKEEYNDLARSFDEGSLEDEAYEQLWEQYLGTTGSPFAIDPNGGMYPEVIDTNMVMLAEQGAVQRVMDLDDVWAPQFVNNYLGRHGWYDTTTQTAGNYLRDLIRRR